MEESCLERQENELQALQAIYMDDFQDLREKPDKPPKVCLKLTPLQSVVAKEVHARVDLIVHYTADYPNRSPKLSLCNAAGISNEDVSELQNELRHMAANLVGEVMVLQLAHHVQNCLHKHNKPQLSFYDKMMANKRKEEERILAAEQQKLRKEIEANKEREEDEKREIEEELQRRGEAMKESRRRRNIVLPEKNTKTDAVAQNSKTRDADSSPISPAKEIPILQRRQSGNSVTPFLPSSPKKTEGMPSGHSIMRRRRSSEGLTDESFTGTRVINFSNRGEHVVHCGKCLGKSSAIQHVAQNLLEHLEFTSSIISKTTSSGLVKLLANQHKGFILSPEVFDILNKLMKSDEENATGDVQLLCKLFSGERCSYHYSTEESTVTPANTPFSVLGFTQLLNVVKLIAKMDHGHGLVDRFLFAIPLAFRPTLTEMDTAANHLSTEVIEDFQECFKNIHENGQLQLTLEPNAQQLLRDNIDQFIAEVNEAIRDGKVPPKSKMPELVPRVAAALHVFNHMMSELLAGVPAASPPTEISKSTLETATEFVQHLESQKDLLCQFLKEITNATCEKTIEQPTLQTIKDQVLLAPGPVVTYRSFKHGKRSAKAIAEPEYSRATESLKEDGFGRIVEFTIPRARLKCQGSSGSRVYSAMDITIGDLVVMCEWSLSPHQVGSRRTLSITENQQQDPQGRLMKQVSSIEQEILSLINRVSHPNLTHYLAVNVQESAPTVNVQVLAEYVGGGDLGLHLRNGGLPLAQLREYTHQLVEALCYLHGKAVVHKDLRLTSCRLDSDGNLRLADYSVGKRLSDLYQVYGGDTKDVQSNTGEENRTTSRYGKTGDIYSLGLLVLSLALGEVFTGDVKEIPTSLPSELRDFLSNCLKADERNRWSASQLLEHSFITPVISNGLPNGHQDAARNNGIVGNDGPPFLVDQPEREEPVPDFSFFSGVPGKSRVKCEFEELQFLGKGGFGNVIKVRNKLDNGLYAVKRIPLNPNSSQFTKRIMREVQLISRLNHENVVRYYNSWIENAVEQEGEKAQSGDEKAAQNPPSAVSCEDSLLELDKIEAPSVRSNENNVEDSWWQEGEEPDQSGSDSSSSGSQESFRSPSKSASSKSHSVSFFSSKSESSEGVVFMGNADESVLQFGDLLDTESDDSDDGVEWQETGTESSTESVGLQYLYIQMEYCEKSTLRNVIDEGLHQDKDRVWRLFREIVEGLAHIHTQGIIHRDLKPVNLFLDSHGSIKIGDFGLATTHGMTRGGMGPDLPDSVDKTQSPKSSSTTKESMTGKVGTALYVAPELGKRSGVRVKYSQKVDLYSLGIIFFEMCYKPLTTSMERVKVLGNLRTERIVFPGEFDHKRLAKEMIVLKWLLKHNPEERPSSQELLQSQCIPPKIEDGQLDEVLKHTLASTKTTRYQRLMKAVFSQHVSSVKDVTYDIEVYTGQMSPRAILAQQMVHESVKSVFLRHGALRLRTSLLAPRTKLFEQLELAVNVMDHSGTLVTLPYDLRVPFARYIARNCIVDMKRFDIGCVYRDRRILGSHPKELYECVFDIVTSTPENLVPDAEVLLSVAEIIREFPSLHSRNYYIRVNHAALMKCYLTSVGISDERQSELLAILQEVRSEKDRNDQIHEFVESLQLSEHTATALCEFLEFEGPVSKLREHLIGTMKRKTWVGLTARQSFHDLEEIASHVETFGIDSPVVVDTSMVYNFYHFSGLIFQFVAANKRKRKRGGVDILAAGGRYDKLISHFRRGAEAVHPSPGAVGVSIAIEKIVAAVLEDEDYTIPSAYDVFVCSAGHNPMLAERMHIARDLWKAGIRATICYDSKDMIPLEELQEFCKQGGIQHMVVLKEQETGSVRVRSLDKEKIVESRVLIKDLVDHLQGKLSTRPETTESSAPLSNKGTGTQSGNEPTSTFAPEMKVSFNTQVRMAWNTKKRYESLMMSKIKPSLTHINSKSAVEVIGVDLPGAVLRSMAAMLDLDSNEDAFDASVATIADKNPRYKKYIGRVCDDIRDLKVSKKVPVVFVYSVKDEMFKIFF